MMNRFLFGVVLFAGLIAGRSAQAITVSYEVSGYVLEQEVDRPVPEATIAVTIGGRLIGRATSDENGFYRWSGLVNVSALPVTADVTVTAAGFFSYRIITSQKIPSTLRLRPKQVCRRNATSGRVDCMAMNQVAVLANLSGAPIDTYTVLKYLSDTAAAFGANNYQKAIVLADKGRVEAIASLGQRITLPVPKSGSLTTSEFVAATHYASLTTISEPTATNLVTVAAAYEGPGVSDDGSGNNPPPGYTSELMFGGESNHWGCEKYNNRDSCYDCCTSWSTNAMTLAAGIGLACAQAVGWTGYGLLACALGTAAAEAALVWKYTACKDGCNQQEPVWRSNGMVIYPNEHQQVKDELRQWIVASPVEGQFEWNPCNGSTWLRSRTDSRKLIKLHVPLGTDSRYYNGAPMRVDGIPEPENYTFHMSGFRTLSRMWSPPWGPTAQIVCSPGKLHEDNDLSVDQTVATVSP